MSKKSIHQPYSFWFPLAFLTLFLVGTLIGIKLEKEAAIAAQTTLQESGHPKIDALFRLLDAKYLTKIDQHKLLQQTIDRLKTSEIDTNYIPSKQLKRINEQLDIKPY